jgi:hypothetical protein
MVEKLALTISEAAALGGPCRSALYQDIKKGRLRAIKRGRGFYPSESTAFFQRIVPLQ